MKPRWAWRSVRDLGEALRAGETTSTELTELSLSRLAEHGPRLNAVVNLTRERALRQAKKADRELKEGRTRGPLHGVPWGGKDLLAVKGYPTTWGAAPYKDRVLDYDATAVTRLDGAGAVLCAKLAMIELAGGGGYRQPNAAFTGPPKTPWSLGHWSGGSSSGSGASVGAGLVPFAVGSETWGSILSPANNCGVSGLRPTYGLVSRHGAMALSWTLDKLGPLCLTADDCGLVLEAISGRDPKDPSTSSQKFRYQPADGDFKVGLLKGCTEGCDPAVEKNFNAAVRVVEKYAAVEEFEFPEFPYEQVTRTILNAEAISAFDEFVDAGLTHGLTAPEDHFGMYSRLSVLAVDYLRALRLRAKMARMADEAMSPYDAVVAPTGKRTAPPIDQEFRRVLGGFSRDLTGAIGNGAGLPAVGVPSGFDEVGLPTSIQFMGRAYDENRILGLAVEYQRRTRWHSKRPKGF